LRWERRERTGSSAQCERLEKAPWRESLGCWTWAPLLWVCRAGHCSGAPASSEKTL
ncbi:hypothetical protein NDU88_004166, partial [Pleurodeles waltl]